MKKIVIISLIVSLFVVLLSLVSIKVTVRVHKNTNNPKQEQVNSVQVPSRYIGRFSISHYCSCPVCTGTPNGSKTAVGHKPREGRTVAVDPKVIPLHSVIYVEGLGTFVAEDTGSAIKKNHLDIYINDHQRALKLGTLGNRKFKVYILD